MTIDDPVLDQRSRDEVQELLDHVDANHADTVLFLARHAAGCPDATDAETAGVDGAGLDLTVVVDGRRSSLRLPFDRPIASSTEAYEQLTGLLASTRAAVGDDVPLTSIESEQAALGSIRTFVTRVRAVRDLTPNLREVELSGGLDDFRSAGGDQFVYLMVPRADGPEVAVDHDMAAQQAAAADEAPHAAYYTVRAWDAAEHRLVLWMVVHGHDSGVGAWAASCRPGERVALWGPRHGIDVRPRPHVFVADESGLAAVAAILDELPRGTPTRVIAETVDERHVVDLPTTGATTFEWHFRRADEPGTGTRLLDAVRRCDVAGASVFGAGESRQMTAIRKHVRHERGLPAADVSITGYWRRALSR